MDGKSSIYEEAQSQVNKIESNNSINNVDNKFNNAQPLETKNINDNKIYNNNPDNNIILNNNINNDNSQLNSKYSSARGFETQFENEKTTSYYTNCKCIIF